MAGWLSLVSLSLLLAGCDLPGRPTRADRPIPADKVLDFGILYRENCAGCHGSDGRLGPAPPLNDSLFRAIVPEEEVAGIVTKGRKKTLMPAFAKENGGPLTAAQIQVLVKEIKGISYKIVEERDVVADAGGIAPKWGVPAAPPDGVPSYREPSAGSQGGVAGKKEKGMPVFARACAHCHGDQGQGVERGGEMVRTIHDPVFLALTSNQALRRYVITGRPDLGMPNYAEPRQNDPHFTALTDQEITDLVALLASWRREE
jgi:cytochrome c oxidase cbb3-type subunit 3